MLPFALLQPKVVLAAPAHNSVCSTQTESMSTDLAAALNHSCKVVSSKILAAREFLGKILMPLKSTGAMPIQSIKPALNAIHLISPYSAVSKMILKQYLSFLS